MRLPIAMFAVLVAGCGDDPRRCGADYGQIPGCYAAQLFASRDTDAIVPTQDELDRYFDRWTRAIAAEPILEARAPHAVASRSNRSLHPPS